MKGNSNKSIISLCGIEEENVSYFMSLFLYKGVELDCRLKYLGFFIKPNNFLNPY